MTCIVGIRERHSVIIGADSCGGNPDYYFVVTRRDPKIFRVGSRMVIGYTTSYRMGQLLQYKLSVDLPTITNDLHKWACTIFIDAVRSCLKEGGFTKKDSEREENGSFILGIDDRLFIVYGDNSVEEPDCDIASVGSGSDIALGAMHAMRSAGRDERSILLAGLEAAGEFNAYVRPPWHFKSTGWNVTIDETQHKEGICASTQAATARSSDC